MWGIDLGTTNTGIARWNDADESPQMVDLPKISRRAGQTLQRDDGFMIPSAVEAFEHLDFWGRFGRWGPISRRFFVGKQALIGWEAIKENQTKPKSSYAKSFKRQLAQDPHQTIARLGNRALSARNMARLFIRELLGEVKKTTGEYVRELTFTTPVDSYETYRAELATIAKSAGVREVHFLDEPVAAAVGYGLSLHKSQNVLVVDFGGGTLDLALVNLDPRDVEEGQCRVLAKAGRPIGGELVDRWIVEAMSEKLKFRNIHEFPEYWHKLMRAEACRVKESLFLKPEEVFVPVPPRLNEPLLEDAIRFTKDDLVALIEKRGVHEILEECTIEILRQAEQELNVQVDEVLMVGGSTLLPGVYAQFENRFGREKVRAWQPFEAVVLGAGVFAAGKMQQLDFIVHDYAFVTHDMDTHEAEHSIIIPRGTRFPTKPDFWKRQVVPTCSLGEPEKIFKLVISEIGQNHGGGQRYIWDAQGELHKMGEGAEEQAPVVVPLNDKNPTLGILNPPHHPRDKSSRLDIAFGVNADRWLCATVFDLHTKKHLMQDEPVVRLV